MTSYALKNTTARPWLPGFALAATLALVAQPALADTVAYWRFEDGPVDTDVNHIAVDANTWSADVLDVSGNGNHLSTWVTGDCCGYGYRSDVSTSTIAATGEANNFSVVNTGSGPGMFTGPTGIQSIAPEAFAIEVSFQPEAGGFRTIVGRDSLGAATINPELSGLYLQLVPGDALAFKFADQAGFWHEAISQPGIVNTYNFPETENGNWYHAAAVSDGSTMSLYLANADAGTGYQLIAQADISASGSTNTALTPGMGDGGDWDAGNWTVGRGLYNGGHGDRAYGFIDEVRISDDAVGVNDFLHFASGQNLSIEVNSSTGEVSIRNDSAGAVTLDYYEIKSAAGGLSTGSWNSLSDQDFSTGLPGDYNADGSVNAADYTTYRDGLGTTFAPADYDVWAANYGLTAGGEGVGWTEAGGSDANILSELLLDEAGSTLLPGQSISLGSAYSTGLASGDLSFSYGRPGTGLFVGGVNYTGASTTIPEPGTACLLAIGLVGLASRRRPVA